MYYNHFYAKGNKKKLKIYISSIMLLLFDWKVQKYQTFVAIISDFHIINNNIKYSLYTNYHQPL